jgi:hypothetical protein
MGFIDLIPIISNGYEDISGFFLIVPQICGTI